MLLSNLSENGYFELIIQSSRFTMDIKINLSDAYYPGKMITAITLDNGYRIMHMKIIHKTIMIKSVTQIIYKT